MARETWTDDRMDDLARRVDAGFTQVDRRFGQIESQFEGRFAELHDDIRALQAESKEAVTRQGLKDAVADLRSEMNLRFMAMDERFNGVGQCFDAVDKRFDAVDQRFEAVDQRFDAVDKRFDAVDQRFEAVDQRFDAVDQRFDRVDKGLDAVRERIEKRFDMLQTTLIAAILTGIIGVIASHVG